MDFKLVQQLREASPFAPVTDEEAANRKVASPAAQDLEVDSIQRDTEKRSRRNLAVYADVNRPFNNGDIVADIAWRRSEHMIADKGKVLAALAPFLSEKGITRADIAFIKYDRFCGCKMCPCSPGFTVRLKKDIDASYDIWLTPKKV